MIKRSTWLKVADTSQAKWLKVFSLYGGFFRKSSSVGNVVKGSVRVVQPFFNYYKGFSKKQIVKGRVSKTLFNLQAYVYVDSSRRVAAKSSINSSILLKKKLNVRARHAIGPAFLSGKKKKFNSLFKFII